MSSGKVMLYICRQFSTTNSCNGKKNFRKFILHDRGSNLFKEKQKTDPDPDIPVYKYGMKEPGYRVKNKFIEVPEMIPELIVPDLTDFKLKPYVTYKVEDIIQHEFTAQDLFHYVYSEKIKADFKAGKLDEEGMPLEPSKEEKMTPEEAKLKADQTGSDLFCQRSKKQEEDQGLRY